MDEEEFIKVEDFDERVKDVIPVSDPNASTMAQRNYAVSSCNAVNYYSSTDLQYA